MLRQDHGADKTRVIARAPKVILSRRWKGLSNFSEAVLECGGSRNWEYKANLKANPSGGLQEIGGWEILAIPHSWRTPLVQRRHIYG